MNNISLTSPQESLNYLHVKELKEHCASLLLSTKGTKSILISRIIHFIKTGEKIESPKYPSISCAKSNKTFTPHPESLMLKGLYKNDLKTRIFFKNLIGEYFHFTAFGIDWLEERWMEGRPPTYREFAAMWQNEYAYRKENGSTPKDEWAYINFVQRYLKDNPDAKKKDILKHWDIERQRHKDLVEQLMRQKS